MKKSTVASAVVVGLIGCAVGYLFVTRPTLVTADDSYRTTAIQQTTYDFEDGTGSEAAVVATLITTSASDENLKIEVYVTPPGGSEGLLTFASAPRNGGTGNHSVLAAIATTGMASGTTIRAQYLAWDGSSNQTLSYSRSTTLP